MNRPAIGFEPIHMESYSSFMPKQKKARWDGKPKRCPKKGEYFISGAVPVAYLAYSDLTTPYFIAVPIL